jgi:hypothetical protein
MRLYKRLGVEDKSDAEQDQLRREFVALMKYRDHWYYAGLEAIAVGGCEACRGMADCLSQLVAHKTFDDT